MLARCASYEPADLADCHWLERRQSRQHGDGRSLISGGLADAELRRILSYLFVNCFARSECGNWVTIGALIALFILDHNCRASSAQLAMVVERIDGDQYRRMLSGGIDAVDWRTGSFHAESALVVGCRRYARSSERVVLSLIHI